MTARAPCPAREEERLERVRTLGHLEGGPSTAFHDVVRLAAYACAAPIAAMTLIDRERTRLLASVGLPALELPRQATPCAYAILEPGQLTVVEDAGRDPRFASMPLVLEAPYARLYAGAPLVTHDGLALGTLCVLDPRARPFEPEQREALARCGRVALRLLEGHGELGLEPDPGRAHAALAALARLDPVEVDLRALEQGCVELVARALGADLVELVELLPGGACARLVAGVGWREGLVGTARLDAGPDSRLGLTLRADAPLVVGDLRAERQFRDEPHLQEHGVVSGISVVIPTEEGPYGVLAVHSRARRFGQAALPFLRAAAGLLGGALTRRRGEARRKLQADAPTGRVVLRLEDPSQDWSLRVVEVDVAAAAIVGAPTEALIGRWLIEAFPLAVGYVSDLAEVVRTGRPHRGRYGDEARVFQAEAEALPGSRAVVTFSEVQPGRPVGGAGHLPVQSRFIQAQKLEALGRLTSGVAHDFNNLLTVVSGYAGLIRGAIGEADVILRYADEIECSAGRAQELTRQLLAFSRKQDLAPRVLDPNDVLTGLCSMLGRLLGEGIELAAELDPSPGAVMVDRGRLEQAIVNLVVNARDAMPAGGRITLGTSRTTIAAGASRVLPPGAYAALTVTDTGCGMDAATLARLFEPFFTTKEPGRGTGLGLSTAQAIVRQFGGDLLATSSPGQGSCFQVLLPIVDAPVDQAITLAPPPPPPLTTPGRALTTILLVEDEPAVREVAARILGAAGYTVVAAASPGEARVIVDRYRGPIHLLLLDVLLPGTHGSDLGAQLTANRPDMRVLYMSGESQERLLERGRLSPEVDFLAKPFNPALLVQRVEEALEAI